MIFFLRFHVSLLFSLIYVCTIHQCILFHILKNHKKLRSNFKTCNPSRLEFSNKSPLKDKEKAEILKTKLKNLDLAVHAMSSDEPWGSLDVKEDQPREKVQRDYEDLYIQINDLKLHMMIKSFFPWKYKPKQTFIVMI